MSNNKQLPAAVQKVLQDKKLHWTINNCELSERLKIAEERYQNQYPIVGDNNSRFTLKYFNNFYDFLNFLNSEDEGCKRLDIDLKQSRHENMCFKVCFIKEHSQQKEDIERISNEVKSRYEQELAAVKQEYIENLLNDHNEQQAEAKAQKEQEQQAKLREQLLSMLN